MGLHRGLSKMQVMVPTPGQPGETTVLLEELLPGVLALGDFPPVVVVGYSVHITILVTRQEKKPLFFPFFSAGSL